MDCEYPHPSFDTWPRLSHSLCNDRCQNVLYKAVFEHFIEIKDIAALLLASKSFQNSSFGANYIVTFAIDQYSIDLFDSVLSPSSCFSIQFVPSLRIRQWTNDSDKINRGISNFVSELVDTKYLHLSLRSLTLDSVTKEVLPLFFGSSSNVWPQLQHLCLKGCWVNNQDLEVISKNVAQLRVVNLTSNKTITDAGLEHLSKLSGITSLNFENCNRITDVGLEHISKIAGMTSLNLHGCHEITHAGLESIANLDLITSLNLCRGKITDAGLEHVSKLSHINFLDLAHCNLITDAGLDHLSKLSGINSLNLYRCSQITDAGLEHVSKLSGITDLNLRDCHSITNVGLARISKLSGITSLNLYRCSQITDAGLEHVSKLSGITTLSLFNCNKITDAGLEHISKLSGITSLDLSFCDKITDAGLEHIARLSGINSLNLCNCHKITDVGLEHISKLPGITGLCKLSRVYIASLNLSGCNLITAKAKHKLRFALPDWPIDE